MFESRGAKKFRNKKVKTKFRENIEPQEVFLDSLAQRREAEFGVSEKKFEVPLSGRILQGFLIFTIILILGLFCKTFQFQVLEHKGFLAQAQENKFIIKSLQASRGVIYDSKENQLVFNKSSFDLIADKKELPQSDDNKKNIFKTVSNVIKWNFEDLERKINNSEDQIILVLENLDHQTLILLETKIAELPGFEIQRNSTRDYEESKIFSHIIGYTGKINAEELGENPDVYLGFDYVGRAGVEKSYEEVLRKNPGKIRMEKDVYGHIISREAVSLPESGKSLILWLDSELQKKITTELEKMIKNFGAKEGTAVALNPKTGGVMALVSLPSFDNNLFNKGTDPEALKNLLQDAQHPLYNRVIAGQYPVGSTIKPLTASAALQEKLISPSKNISCEGKITIPHRYDPEIIYEYKDWTIHGWTNMRKAIAESCNVYFYTIGGGYENQKGLGPSRIKKYLELFGWGDKTQIDLPGEGRGFIPSPQWKEETKKEGWWDGDTYNLAIGQGDIAITPLQVAASFVAIANRGTLYQPKIVQKIIDPSTSSGQEAKVIEEISPTILRENFIDSENLQVVRDGMRQAVTGEGAPQASSILLNSLPVKVAAKTGTAQLPKYDHYNNWITVFAPYEDPEIVLTVMIGNVKGMQTAAIPVAKEILNWYFSEKGTEEPRE